MGFATIIREARISSGVTQDELATLFTSIHGKAVVEPYLDQTH
jgi:ribosome-binding protein aMBF1 (putative translation factor)